MQRLIEALSGKPSQEETSGFPFEQTIPIVFRARGRWASFYEDLLPRRGPHQGHLVISSQEANTPDLLRRWSIFAINTNGRKGKCFVDRRESDINWGIDGRVSPSLTVSTIPKWAFDNRQNCFFVQSNDSDQKERVVISWEKRQGLNHSIRRITFKETDPWYIQPTPVVQYQFSESWSTGNLKIGDFHRSVKLGAKAFYSPLYSISMVYGPDGLGTIEYTPVREDETAENPEEIFGSRELVLLLREKCPERIDLPVTLRNLFSTEITEPNVFKLLAKSQD